MTMRDAWRHSFAGMLLCAALSTNGSAAAGDELAKPAAFGPARRETVTPPIVGDDDPPEKTRTSKDDTTKPTDKVKVFRLKSADPELAKGVVVGLLSPRGSTKNTVMFGTEERPFSIASDARTRSIIARGCEEALAVAADVVTVLDHPADKPVPKMKYLGVFRLKFAVAGEVAHVLNQLSFDSRIAGTDTTLFVLGPETELKQIGEVIEQLDVERKAPKPEEKPEGGTGSGMEGGN